MTKKSLGYVHLEWTCPNCETRNPGPQKVCSSCGMPQPEDVEFEQPAQEKIIEDEAEIERAKAGPDIHCYYCGSRNPADAETCSQCGAPLGEGTARSSGQVLGAHRHKAAEKITCPACGTPNEADAPKCVQCGASLPKREPEPTPSAQAKTTPKQQRRFRIFGGVTGVVILLLICAGCITFFALYNRTEDLTGRVEKVSWTRDVTIESLVPVTYEDWRDEIPAEGLVGTCTQKIHHTQNNPAPNSREVCGTPYTVDTGSGFGEVVQDCRYQVYQSWCEYSVEEWQEVDTVSLSGNDFNPRWPNPHLRTSQREGERDEIYRIIFETEVGTYTYSTSNPNILNQVEIGSRWLLQVNTFNAVTGIEPLQ